MTKREYSEKEKIKHVEGFKKFGKSLRLYAEKVNVPAGTIKRWIDASKREKKKKTDFKEVREGYKLYPVETKIEALNKAVAGESYADIEAEMGLSTSTVARWVTALRKGMIPPEGLESLLEKRPYRKRYDVGSGGKPLSFDANGRAQLKVLKAQNTYLKTLCEANGIDTSMG